VVGTGARAREREAERRCRRLGARCRRLGAASLPLLLLRRRRQRSTACRARRLPTLAPLSPAAAAAAAPLRPASQSYLCGVPFVVLGLRSREGALLELRTLPVASLPGDAAARGAPWAASAWQLLAFGDALLAWAVGVCRGGAAAGRAVRFTYEPDGRGPGRVTAAIGGDGDGAGGGLQGGAGDTRAPLPARLAALFGGAAGLGT